MNNHNWQRKMLTYTFDYNHILAQYKHREDERF